MHREFVEQPTDEILESIWRLRERGENRLSMLLAQAEHADDEPLVRRLSDDGLLRTGDDRLELTPEGETRARTIVRCHRLAERLLHDVLRLSADQSEQTACLMEHVLSPEVADAVCAFLGHPPTGPDGTQIPAGSCCTSDDRGVRAVVVPLGDLELGKSARIVFMAQRSNKRVDRLGSYGVVPGRVIRLRQRQPSYVIELDGTSLALDADVAREIYVRRET